jgi:hypothetical protein
LLIRTPVSAVTPFRYIGKETDRRWEQGEDISMLDSKIVEYSPNETARLVHDPELQQLFGRSLFVSWRKLLVCQKILSRRREEATGCKD